MSKPNEMEVLRSKARAILSRELAKCTTAINPAIFGEMIFDGLRTSEREERP